MSATPWTDSHRYSVEYDDMIENTEGDWVPVEVCRAIEEQLNSNGGAHAGFSGAVAHWTERYKQLLADYEGEVKERVALRQENAELKAKLRQLEGLPPERTSVTHYEAAAPLVFVDPQEAKS